MSQSRKPPAFGAEAAPDFPTARAPLPAFGGDRQIHRPRRSPSSAPLWCHAVQPSRLDTADHGDPVEGMKT